MFQEVTFPAGEEIVERGEPLERLLLITKGVVGAFGKVLTQGDIIGDETILDPRRRSEGDYQAGYCATALTFTVVKALSLSDLLEVVEAYPEVKQRAQKALCWEAARQNCWAYASAVLEVRGKKRLRSAAVWPELVDFYKWKVAWFNVKGLSAVTLFRSVITIQRTARGFLYRKRFGKEKEEGTAAIHLATKNIVAGATDVLLAKMEQVGLEQVVSRAKQRAKEIEEERKILLMISRQIRDLNVRLARLETTEDTET